MATAFDGSTVPGSIIVETCHETAVFNSEAGHGYVCLACLCVVGSAAMPRECALPPVATGEGA